MTFTAEAGPVPDAALDLDGFDAASWADLRSRISDGTAHLLAEQMNRVGFCTHPVRLKGTAWTINTATGEVVDSWSSDAAPGGVLVKACGNRRASVCPACSRVYARDTFEVVRAGVQGGKSVPESVAGNPLVFATLTAPSFGRVHGVRDQHGRCRPTGHGLCPHGRPTWCHRQHTDTDPTTGAPLCDDCYDWASAVVWQWWAPELWRRFTIALSRTLAAHLGVPQSRLRDHASVQFAKVAEYQARGLVHFHVLVRLDGPGGPGSPAPVAGDVLADLVRTAATQVTFDAPPVDATDTTRVLRFGAQIDVRTVRAGLGDGDLTGETVAAYLAKYATKSVTDGPAGRAHLAVMRHWCDRYAHRATVADLSGSPYRLVGKWAHMLGFRGHFSTRSRRYSVPIGRLRAARARYQRLTAHAARQGRPIDTRDLEARLLADETETTLVVGSFTYLGTGWERPGDEALALAAAARAREHAQHKAQLRHHQPGKE